LISLIDCTSHKGAWSVAVKTSLLGAGNLRKSDSACSLAISIFDANKLKGLWMHILTKTKDGFFWFCLNIKCNWNCVYFALHAINLLKHVSKHNPKTFWFQKKKKNSMFPFFLSYWNFCFVGFGGAIWYSDAWDARWSTNSWGLSLVGHFNWIE
jgi:hypothetical protein